MNTAESPRTRLLAAIDRLRPLAEQHAAESERGRTLAPPVVEALRDGDLLMLAAPRALGGLECDPVTQLEVFEHAARADTSLGWCLMIAALHNAMAGAYLPDVAAAEVFAPGRVPLCAGLVHPAGVATPADGGFVLNGRWAFGSGIRHAEWVMSSALLAGTDQGNGPPEFVHVAVARERVVVEDTWHVSGLRGTGSEHYRMEGVFVPATHAYPFPFAPARRGGALYDLPVVALLAPGHAGFALGLAQRALDEVVSLAPRRARTWTRSPLAEHGAFLMDLGRQRAKLSAARALAVEAFARMASVVRSGDALGADDWVPVRLAVTHATDVAAEVATFAYRAGGSGALYEPHALQRCLRDVYAATQHVAATDDAYEFAGRVMLDTPPFSPMLLPRAPREAATP